MELSWVAACFGTLLLTDVVNAASWSYEGERGPQYWHELFPEVCSGKYQSPIDLRPEETMYNPELKEFAIWYDPPKPDSRMTVLNNGHTVQVTTEGEFYVTNGGLPYVYKTVQFHFHWGHAHHHGSEHLIDGKSYPLELHIVSYNKDLYSNIAEAATEKQGLAVLGVMYEISEEDNSVLEPIVSAMRQARDPEAAVNVDINPMGLRNLLPDTTNYFRYNGSLTTPGCFESVIWTVFEKTQTISHKQLNEFREMLQNRHSHGGHHKRSVPSGRPVTRSERNRERRALEVLEELGMGNDFELQERFRRELVEKKAHSDDHDGEIAAKVDEENAGQIHQKTLDHVRKNNSPEQDVNYDGGDKAEEVHVEFVQQEKLVNNFRPVQPLNGRIVYRSFKLRESMEMSEDSSEMEVLRERLKHYEAIGGAEINIASLVLLASCLVVFFL